jgi:hypothetical protein
VRGDAGDEPEDSDQQEDHAYREGRQLHLGSDVRPAGS